MKENKSFYTLIIGSLLSAILAGSCCLAPLFFLLFGVSVGSLSFLQVFAPFQLYFALASVLVILYLWYNYFKSKKAIQSCNSSLCKHHKLYLGLGTLFVGILVTYPYWVHYILE